MVDVTDVNLEDVTIVWPLVQDALEEVVSQSTDYVLQDVYVGLMTGQMKLWISYEEEPEGNRVRSFAVVELRQETNRIVCFILFAAGGTLEDWELGSECIEDWAMQLGATAVQAHTRPGVVKRFKDSGYKPVATVVEKELTQRRLH